MAPDGLCTPLLQTAVDFSVCSMYPLSLFLIIITKRRRRRTKKACFMMDTMQVRAMNYESE